MWKEFVFTLGSTLIFGLYYKFNSYKEKRIDYIRFLVSRDLPLKNVLDNEQIVLELGVSSHGSFIQIRDLSENIKSVVKLKSVDYNNKEYIKYIFEDDSKLTFTKENNKNILCYYESDNQMICHEYVNDFIKNYKTMCFDTDFDLLSQLKQNN